MAKTEILQFIHSVKKAKLNLEVFCNGSISDRSRRKFKGYINRLEFMIQDLKTEPLITTELRNAIEEEYSSDVYTIDAITEKVLLLTPDERETLETIIDCVIKGEQINIVYDKPNELTNDTNK